MHRKDGGDGGGKLLLAGAIAWASWQIVQSLRKRSLQGEVVLITGGSRGLGLLLAREFASQGCAVVICARDEQELDQARMDLERRGARVLALQCDVSDQGSVAAVVAQATAAFGRIDIVINNAGIMQVGPFDTMRVQDFERAMAINFWGAVYTTFAVLPQMRARGHGQIVNVTSIGGKVSLPHLLPYDCAKFAMVALSEGLHAELAQHGIQVTTIVPGLMRTGSPANAVFKGEQGNEFGWFTIASATPLTAMSARRAARRIVAATRRREAEVTLTVQAKLLRAMQGIAPGAMQRFLSLINRALPHAAAEQTAEARGMELSTPLAPSPLTILLNHAARDTNQYEGTAQPAPQHAHRVGLGNGSRARSRPRREQ